MKRKPRSPDDPVIGRALGVRLGITGLVISIGVLIVVSWGETRYGLAVATTMGFVTTALMHIVASLEWRDPERTIFTPATIANGRFNLMVLLALVFTFMATTLNGLERILETVDLSGAQWRACWLAVLAYLVLAELEKLILPRITHNER
jgi:Ca2+-transporting ATPase